MTWRPLVAEFSLKSETCSLLLSWSELHLSAGRSLLRHWFHWGASSRFPPVALRLLPAHGGFLVFLLSRAAGDGCAGWRPLSSEGTRLQAPPAARQLLLPGIQELHGAGHQPPCAPPPHRQLNTSCRRLFLSSFFPCWIIVLSYLDLSTVPSWWLGHTWMWVHTRNVDTFLL